eukprot:TRINITY_DN7132_c0_g1_i2.p1 TRINITY_DN7132_c0_g1~~TRINITY_DN7132_c0_g1_i2.p1  ORF type:complete len:403 (-),score=170.46 TRINITY_DN7132_c0_g1_i2:114-1322(-)
MSILSTALTARDTALRNEKKALQKLKRLEKAQVPMVQLRAELAEAHEQQQSLQDQLTAAQQSVLSRERRQTELSGSHSTALTAMQHSLEEERSERTRLVSSYEAQIQEIRETARRELEEAQEAASQKLVTVRDELLEQLDAENYARERVEAVWECKYQDQLARLREQTAVEIEEHQACAERGTAAQTQLLQQLQQKLGEQHAREAELRGALEGAQEKQSDVLAQLQREADHADREARAAQEDALAGQRKLKVVQEQLHSERQRTSVLQQQLDRAAQHARGAEHREKASAAAHQASQQAQLGCESKLRADKEALQRELEGLQAQLVHQRTSNSVDEYQSWKRRLDASLSLSPSVLRVPEECPVARQSPLEMQDLASTTAVSWPGDVSDKPAAAAMQGVLITIG